MEISECRGQKVKISRGSITVKSDNGKTCGIVKNIVSLYNIRPNKQFEIFLKLNKNGLSPMRIGPDKIIIKDENLYFFRDIKSKQFYEKYGYFSDDERKKAEREEDLYKKISECGYDVIECIFV